MRLDNAAASPSVCMLLQNAYDIDIRVRRKALIAAGYTGVARSWQRGNEVRVIERTVASVTAR